jgi:hypothetical protein
MGLNFIGANWMDFFLQDQNPNWRILQGLKAHFTLLYFKAKNTLNFCLKVDNNEDISN